MMGEQTPPISERPRAARDAVTRRARLLAVALVGVLAMGAAASGLEDRRDQVIPYLRALETRAVGEIAGRAYGIPRRPSAPPPPFEGVSVLAFPYAADVDAHLDAIKQQQRDSMGHYTDTYADLTALREAYERELLAAGAGELIRGAVSDAAGQLRLEGVPAGEWLVLGWREEPHAVKMSKTPSKDAGHFAPVPTLTGFATVSFWRLRVSLRAGETAEVSLSDRSVWLNAVREEFTHSDDEARGSGSKKRR